MRCPALAAAVPLFEKDDDGGSGGWAQVALKLLELAPDKRAFLDIVSSRFMPSGWSGSLANILEDRRQLPQALMGCADAVVASWAREQDEALAKWAEEERQRERKRDERFE